MDILNLAIPVVGAFGAFLLALLAIKQRTLLDFFSRGIDQTKALPNRAGWHDHLWPTLKLLCVPKAVIG